MRTLRSFTISRHLMHRRYVHLLHLEAGVFEGYWSHHPSAVVAGISVAGVPPTSDTREAESTSERLD